jgi:hypothetical protein
MLRNVAPVNPNSILTLFEGVIGTEGSQLFFSRKNDHFIDFTRLLRSIAYDPELFERATKLLCLFALAESSNENNNSIRRLVKSLFYIYLSGTHASAEQRLYVISTLIESGSEDRVDLGLSLLSASLEAWHFNSSYSFEFGAHARDYGWSPKNSADINHWYKSFLDYIIPLTVSEKSFAIKLRNLLAEKFRGLWTKAAMYDELETAVKNISVKHSWNEGWKAVKSTIRFDAKRMNTSIVSRLNTLAEVLTPTTLIDRIRVYTLSSYTGALDLVDTIQEESDETDSYTRVQITTRSLGREVGSNIELVNILLSELLSREGARIFDFGQGLAEGSSNPRCIWVNMLRQLYTIPETKRNYQLLRGFLNGLSVSNNDLCDDLLNESITDQFLSTVFPIIQTSVDINQKGIERLKQSLELESAPISIYQNLAYGRALDDISDSDFCDLLQHIASKSEGCNVAIEILHMRIDGKKKENISDLIISLGQKLLVHCSFTHKSAAQLDYELANIIGICFSSKDTVENARIVANRIDAGLENNDIYPSDFDNVLKAIASTHPFIFLDVFLGEKEDEMTRLIYEDIDAPTNPLSSINDDVILTWCDINSEIRYPILASVIVPYKNIGQGIEWTALANTLIRNSSDPVVILNKFKYTFRPTSWSGSRSETMQSFIPLISQLQQHEDPIVSQWAIHEERAFSEEIRSEYEWEMARNRERNERFE